MVRLGLIGGTGLDHWGSPVRSHALEGPYGCPSAGLAEFQLDGLSLFFLPRHGLHHEIPPHAINYRANIDSFRQLKVDSLIAINAVGGISTRHMPGSLAIPDQLIDYTWGREHSFSLDAADDLAHVEFAEPFDRHLHNGLVRAASVAGVDVEADACVAVSQGPRLETAAEIRRFRQDGCDLVGMTSMPEAALAREAGLPYASICVSANWAAGVQGDPISMDAIRTTLSEAMIKVRMLLNAYFKECSNVE